MPRAIKASPLTPWTLRITAPYTDYDSIEEWLKNPPSASKDPESLFRVSTGVYVLSYENKSKDGSPANPHYHIYMESNAPRQRIAESIRLLGYKNNYSLSAVKSGEFLDIAYIAYCIKQGEYRKSYHISDELIQEAKKLVEEYNNKKIVKNPTILDKIIEEYKYDEVNNAPVCFTQIVDDVIAFWAKERRSVRIHMITSTVGTLGLRYCPEETSKYIKDKVIQAFTVKH